MQRKTPAIYYWLRRRKSPLLRIWKIRIGDVIASLSREEALALEGEIGRIPPEGDPMAVVLAIAALRRSPSSPPPPPAPAGDDLLAGVLALARALRRTAGYQPTAAMAVAADPAFRPAARALAQTWAAVDALADPEIREAFRAALEEARRALEGGARPGPDPDLDEGIARALLGQQPQSAEESP